MTLFLDSGASGQSARRDLDSPPAIHVVPDPGVADTHGALFACADGLVDRPDADAAARDALAALQTSFGAAPETWAAQLVLHESMQAAHHALRHAGERGRAAAVSALVLRRRRWRLAHAGHTRVWLYRDNQLRQLTRDHLVPRPLGPWVVARACGLDADVQFEFAEGDLRDGDIFLITTAGVHNAIDGARILSVLHGDGTAQQLAEALVRRARDAGAAGGLSACVARVERLPAASALDDDDGRALPIIAPPAVGATLDNFTIEKRLHQSRNYTLYRATDRASGDTVVLKFPQPGARDEAEVARRFLREEWIIRRLNDPHLVAFKRIAPGRRSALYSVMEHQPGENLARRVKRKRGLPVAEARTIATQLLEVLGALHRHGIVHRDVRPSNLLYNKSDKQLLVLGLGASTAEALEGGAPNLPASALSYTAPEVLRGAAANERSNIYAAGVTFYRLISGGFPYGKIKQAGDWPRHEYAPLARANPALPDAMEAVIRRACAPDPADRFGDIAQFAAALAAVELEPPAPRAIEPVRTAASAKPTPPWHWALIGALLTGLVTYLYVAMR